MRIKEILNEDIKIYSAQLMSCSGCDGTGKDRYESGECSVCKGTGSFSEPFKKSIKSDEIMSINEHEADVLYDLLQLMKIKTMESGGYITNNDFAEIRKRIMLLNNLGLSKYARPEEKELGRRIRTVDPKTGLTKIQFIKPKIIAPAISEEKIKELLDNFEKIITDAQKNNLVVFMDDTERPF